MCVISVYDPVVCWKTYDIMPRALVHVTEWYTTILFLSQINVRRDATTQQILYLFRIYVRDTNNWWGSKSRVYQPLGSSIDLLRVIFLKIVLSEIYLFVMFYKNTRIDDSTACVHFLRIIDRMRIFREFVIFSIRFSIFQVIHLNAW